MPRDDGYAEPSLGSYAHPERCTFPTTSGRVLHGLTFQGRDAAERAIVMPGALAAPQRYMNSLALWLSALGYGVLTFDYRGVGESLHAGDPSSNLDDWGDDLLAAIRAAREAFRPRRLFALAHSMGGMLLGHAGVETEVDGALLLAASQGLPNLYRGLGRLRIEAAYRILPPIARAVGELPGWPFLLHTPVPRDVIVHWSRWGLEGGFCRWNGISSASRFAAFRGPMLGVHIGDDTFAPLETVDALLRHFTNAGLRRVVLDPAGHGGGRLGHFGLFASTAPAWSRTLILRWLEDLEEASEG